VCLLDESRITKNTVERRMMMRYQHPEYVEAVRCVIIQRNETAANAFEPTQRECALADA
jgi:hypothetical protein